MATASPRGGRHEREPEAAGWIRAVPSPEHEVDAAALIVDLL